MSPAGYSLLILLIALSNAILGFGTAVLLGHGPRMPELKFAWRDWLAAVAVWWPSSWMRRGAGDASSAAAGFAMNEEPPALTLTPINISDAGSGALLATGVLTHDAISLDAALEQLQREVAVVRNELGALDERVRSCSAAPTVERVEECVADLKQTGRRLYQQQTQALIVVQENNQGAAATDRSDVEESVGERADELRESLVRIDAWQVDPDNLADDCRRLLSATEQMIKSCDEVGQAMENAATARDEYFDPAETPSIVNERHATSHEPIHGVARVGRA